MSYEGRPCKGKFCGRPGLPFLPLRVAYVPEGENDFPNGVSMAPEFFHQELGVGRYMLRTITEGFVFVWDPRTGWLAYGATPDGKFKELPIADDERGDKAPAFACSRQGHNLEASLIGIRSPHNANRPVWVGYTRAWWTRSMRRKLVGDESLRRRNMVEVDAKAVHDGAHPNPEAGFKVDEAGQKLVEHVLEYRDHERANTLYAVTKTVPSPGSEDTQPVLALDRTREAAPQAALMHELSQHGGIALALRDPVGIVQDIAAWRNLQAGKLAEYRLERNNMREHVVAELIGGIEAQLRDAGQVDEWNSRYARHVDTARVTRVRREHEDRLLELEPPIDRAARDWVIWFRSPWLWSALDTYDGEDQRVGEALEKEFADCIDGAGALECEQQVLDEVFEEAPDGKYRALWLAFAAGDENVLEFLADELSAKDGFDLYRDGRELAGSFRTWLQRRRAAGGVRGATVHSGVIGRTLASQMTRLVTEKPDLAPVMGARINIVAAVRMDTVITPFSYTTTSQMLVYELFEAGWEPPGRMPVVRMGQTLHAEQWVRGSWISTRVESETRFTLTMWVPEHLMEEIQAPVASAAAPGGVPPASPIPRGVGASTPLALPAPLPAPVQGLTKWVKTLDARLVGVGGVLSIVALSSALDDYSKAAASGDAESQREAVFGIAAGVMGVATVITEVMAGATLSRVTPAVAQTSAARMFVYAGVWRAAGGALAAGASFSQGVYLFTKARDLARQGATSASSAYNTAGFFFVSAGVAGAATAIIGAKALLVAAGVTASSGGVLGSIVAAGGVLGVIPVWGWIVLGIAALAAGIYFLFRGRREEHTNLEVWMSRSYLRNESVYSGSDRIQFDTLEDELDEFNSAVFGLQIVFEWDENWLTRDRLLVHVVLPGYGERSEYAYRLTLGNSRNDIVVSSRETLLSADPDLRPQERAMPEMRAAPEPGWWERQAQRIDEHVDSQSSRSGWQDTWRRIRRWQQQSNTPVRSTGREDEPIVKFEEYENYALLTAELVIDESFFQQAVLKMEYWPDALQMPQLLMTAGGYGINYRIEGRE